MEHILDDAEENADGECILFFFIFIFFEFFDLCRTTWHGVLQSYDLLQLTECEKSSFSFSGAYFAKRRLVGNKAREPCEKFLSWQ